MDMTICFYIRNRTEFVTKAIKSIRETSDPSIPIVIIQDNSNDETLRLIRRWSMSQSNVNLVENPCKSSCAHLWNMSILLSPTRYVLICGDDAVFHPGWLERLEELVAQGYEYIMGCNHGAFLVDKSIIPKFGYAEERFIDGNYEDNDMVLRLIKRGIKFTNIIEEKLITHEPPYPYGSWSTANNPRIYYAKWQETGPWTGKTEDLAKFVQKLPDINWYPHYTEYCKQMWPHD